MICAHAQYQPRGALREEALLPGIVLSAVLAGVASLPLSLLSGHPPVLALLVYALSGCCGVLAFVTHAMRQAARVS
jgi:hypothetical protein